MLVYTYTNATQSYNRGNNLRIIWKNTGIVVMHRYSPTTNASTVATNGGTPLISKRRIFFKSATNNFGSDYWFQEKTLTPFFMKTFRFEAICRIHFFLARSLNVGHTRLPFFWRIKLNRAPRITPKTFTDPKKSERRNKIFLSKIFYFAS